jgi:hypothetical protein
MARHRRQGAPGVRQAAERGAFLSAPLLVVLCRICFPVLPEG